jgi:SAM-dependent methyltransferase
LHAEDLPFWRELAASNRGGVLELGCGTGRVLLWLASEGYAVTGLDHDHEMLQILANNLSAQIRSRVQLLQADFTAIPLSGQFGLILMPCNTYSTLSDAARSAVLEQAARLLLPEGSFAVSLPNPLRLKRLPRRGESEVEEIFPHPLDNEPVQVSSAWRRQAGQFTVLWYYDHLLPDGAVERLSVQVHHQMTSAEAYLDELHGAGFASSAVYGDFDWSSFTPQSPYMIIIAAR